MKPEFWRCCLLSGFAALSLVAAPAVTAAQVTPPAQLSAASAVDVTGVRVGVHGAATRIVLDVSSPTNFTLAAATTGNAVFVDLPTTRWLAPGFGAQHNQGLLTDFRFGTSPNGGGQLSLLTTHPVRIARKLLLPPSGQRGYRIVFEIIAAGKVIARPPVTNTAAENSEHVLVGPETSSVAIGRSAGSPIRMTNMEIAQVQFPRRRETPLIPQGIVREAMPRRAQLPSSQFGQSARAQPMAMLLTPFYAKGSVGLGFVSGERNEGAGNDNTTEFETGGYLAGVLGVDLRNGFRVEGEMLYSNNEAKSIVGTAAGTALNTGNVEGEVSMLSFMANLAFDIPNQTRLTPFVFGGAGITGLFLNQIETNNSEIYDDVDWVLALQGGAGVNFAIDEQLSIEALYRYLETENPEFNDGAGNPFKSDFSAHYLTIGARYQF